MKVGRVASTEFLFRFKPGAGNMTIALTMIVRDEEANIERCLKSAAPFVDEMIVVDTGSTDATVSIATRRGAKVHHFQWIDDFSAARNFSLEHSPCDWNLVLDADERIVEGGDTLRPLLTGSPFAGIVRRRNTVTIGGITQTSVTQIARLLPRGARYEGRIHEQPVYSVPTRDTALVLVHEGFEAEALAKKKGRNERLLLAELQEHPDDVYLLHQLGKEYQVAEEFGKSAAAFKSALEKSTGNEAFRHALIVRAVYSFKMAGQFDDAVALVDREFQNWPQSPDFFFVVGDLYLELGIHNPEMAMEKLLPVVEFCWKKCLEIGERDDLDGTVRGRGSYMAAHNLATFYKTLGDQANAAKYAAMEAGMRAAAG
jgi:glycosyltransferase involved in cell wall biosynthesis